MPHSKSLLYIDTSDKLRAFCRRSQSAVRIGIDTEFVSENRYRPELCLLQVVTDNELALIDTMQINGIGEFWEMLTQGDHVTIAHAAREEFLFCYRACKRRPKRLFDIQIAAGFVGCEYPASYAKLVSQRLNKTVNKGETRTDWKKRPLTEQQLLYAQEDVEHLIDLYDQLDRSLKSMQRTDWYQEELNDWLDELEEGENEPQWHRISGASRLSRRGLAVLHELWLARDRIACQKNCSPRRVIPDDLLIELAKRGSSRPVHFRSIRGFSHRVAKDLNDQISQAIARANELTEKQLPKKIDRTQSVQLGLVGQYLSIVLGVVCQRNQIAPPLVGTNQELRELAAWHLGKLCENPVPKLSHGWRAAIVGEVIQQALAGKIALRIDNANSDQPLSIRVDSGSENTNNRPTENI